MDHLVQSLITIWKERGLKKEADWALVGGCAGVGSCKQTEQLVLEADIEKDRATIDVESEPLFIAVK
jgi:hypothetical protein